MILVTSFSEVKLNLRSRNLPSRRRIRGYLQIASGGQ
jgi:hypothetical protein